MNILFLKTRHLVLSQTRLYFCQELWVNPASNRAASRLGPESRQDIPQAALGLHRVWGMKSSQVPKWQMPTGAPGTQMALGHLPRGRPSPSLCPCPRTPSHRSQLQGFSSPRPGFPMYPAPRAHHGMFHVQEIGRRKRGGGVGKSLALVTRSTRLGQRSAHQSVTLREANRNRLPSRVRARCFQPGLPRGS